MSHMLLTANGNRIMENRSMLKQLNLSAVCLLYLFAVFSSVSLSSKKACEIKLKQFKVEYSISALSCIYLKQHSFR